MKVTARLGLVKMILGMKILGVTLSGCGIIPTLEYEHVSHLSAGPPFGPSWEEDWVDQINLCGRKEQGRFYSEGCIGYHIGDGGFNGPRDTFTFRTGVHLGRMK